MSRLNILFLFFILLLFSSCGANRKATKKYAYGTPSSSKGVPITDASDGKNKVYSKNKIQNYAELLGVKTKELENKELYLLIDEWMGTPHRMGGLDKRGMDCSGFVGMMYRKVYGKDLPRTSRDMSKHIKKKRNSQLKEGDLVFFSFSGRNVDHVGIYLHNGKFVHVSTRKGVIISNLNDSWYAKYLTRSGTPNI
ncbi:MAG: C40 family peptidase [Sphingobacterium sp.]